MLQRLKEWIALADERLAGTPYKVYMAPGNDDHFEVDKVIEDSAAIVNCNNKNVAGRRPRDDHLLLGKSDSLEYTPGKT